MTQSFVIVAAAAVLIALTVVPVLHAHGKEIPEEWLEFFPPGTKYRATKSPPNMPSVRLSDAEEAAVADKRKIYGGKGDKLHLGGFTDFDRMGVSDNAFNYMIGYLGIKSVVDVGCGKGFSTKFFMDRGANVLCVEGSHDAVTKSLLPADKIVEHDFTRGQWWPEQTYDALWSVEFLEHVGRPYMQNYLPIFHKSALIFVTSSGWGGWHHVEVTFQPNSHHNLYHTVCSISIF